MPRLSNSRENLSLDSSSLHSVRSSCSILSPLTFSPLLKRKKDPTAKRKKEGERERRNRRKIVRPSTQIPSSSNSWRRGLRDSRADRDTGRRVVPTTYRQGVEEIGEAGGRGGVNMYTRTQGAVQEVHARRAVGYNPVETVFPYARAAGVHVCGARGGRANPIRRASGTNGGSMFYRYCSRRGTDTSRVGRRAYIARAFCRLPQDLWISVCLSPPLRRAPPLGLIFLPEQSQGTIARGGDRRRSLSKGSG